MLALVRERSTNISRMAIRTSDNLSQQNLCMALSSEDVAALEAQSAEKSPVGHHPSKPRVLQRDFLLILAIARGRLTERKRATCRHEDGAPVACLGIS
jgi:hypothetical protein